MITSSSIQYISQVLNDPENVSVADKESIDALIETFPYFVPARYMDAAVDQKAQPFKPEVMSRMQLFAGNWLLYNQFLNNATDGQPVATAQQDITNSVPNAVEAAPVAELTIEPVAEMTDVQAEPETVAEPAVTVTEEPVFDAAITTEDIPVVEMVEAPPVVDIAEPPAPASQTPENNESFIVAEPPPPVTETVRKEPLYKELKKQEAYVPENDESFILPVYTEDYFLHQGMQVSNDIPTDIPSRHTTTGDDKQLMVVMSFTEWLMYFKNRREKETEEAKDQKAVKTMWQKEKLAAAMEEENEEIPEKVFEMAVNSITKEDDLASESLADIHSKQGRYDKAIEMYRKLSLRNPQKKAYFARKIDIILKEKES